MFVVKYSKTDKKERLDHQNEENISRKGGTYRQ